ncbi:hypothetical protein [Spirosoma agri]|uniref:Uncharacterized protein n=1 Tax=Spirosoma agri TaxID=1987381 RepID=A0A6M0IEY8_9BACT|nr:hypothetical protein [Spirosoma agri]NEU66846.1 hypothetical protein [Spirosoma agri]
MRPGTRLLLFFLTLLTGCQRTEPAATTYAVPADVEPYIQSFRDELKKRNNPLAIDNLIVTFGTSQQSEDVCGTCLAQAGQTPRITINPDDFCWAKASTNERECLVFHELGHCLLGRAHQSSRFSNHAYTSLMNPDDVAVYATCRYPIGDDVCDKRSRRAYYIDELFDSTTPAPAWSK